MVTRVVTLWARLSALLLCLIIAGLAQAKPVVAIATGTDIPATVAQAISLSGGLKGLVKDGDTVVLKPNLVEFYNPECPGTTTNPEVVRAIIREIKKVARCQIIVAEGSFQDTNAVFEKNGYVKMAAEEGVTLVDTNRDERVTCLKSGYAFRYRMPKTIMTCDVLIDVPVMKTHFNAGVSLGVKNLFGLLPKPRGRYHEQLLPALADLAIVRPPDLTVIDAINAVEGQGPTMGTPVKMDMILAGRDVVATDCVATAVMGWDPSRVEYLQLAARKGAGCGDLKAISVVGKSIAEVKRPFKPALVDAVVELPMTDAVIAKLKPLADKVEEREGRNGRKMGVLTFTAEKLPIDTVAYPSAKSYGFTARYTLGITSSNPSGNVAIPSNVAFSMPGRQPMMTFTTQYELLYPEHHAAALAALEDWIVTNLGVSLDADPAEAVL